MDGVVPAGSAFVPSGMLVSCATSVVRKEQRECIAVMSRDHTVGAGTELEEMEPAPVTPFGAIRHARQSVLEFGATSCVAVTEPVNNNPFLNAFVKLAGKGLSVVCVVKVCTERTAPSPALQRVGLQLGRNVLVYATQRFVTTVQVAAINAPWPMDWFAVVTVFVTMVPTATENARAKRTFTDQLAIRLVLWKQIVLSTI
eukprot:PhF_6_TR38637/c1_g1_i1/m.57673